MRWLALLACAPAIAYAQELPAPELPSPEIEEPEEEERPQILMRITRGQLDDPLAVDEEDDEGPLPRDIPRETSEMGSMDQPRAPEAEREEGYRPPPFSIGVGVGWTRLISLTFDMFMLHQRFEARIPEFPALVLGAGISEMFADRYLIAGGPRVGLGAVMFDERWIACEALVTIQPGVAAGDLGVYFDLNGTLDIRFSMWRTVELGLSGGIHFLGNATMVDLGALIAIPFG